MVTRVASTSSTAQPVTASDPAIPVVPSTGVSNEPTGAVAAAGERELSVTLIGPGLLPTPVKAIVTAPACCADRPATNRINTLNGALPLPVVRDMTSPG